MKQKIFDFIKKETVLCVAAVLAVGSMFLVGPDKEYLGYVDVRVLAILFCLMTVMGGFSALGVFEAVASFLLRKTKNLRQLEMVLVFLCFFCSMFITNDVSLITFVPFAILTLKMAGRSDEMIFVVVMQTIAANLGSMFTPIGNPQNLYLYNLTGMSLGGFLAYMGPYTLISGVILAAFLVFRKSGKDKVIFSLPVQKRERGTLDDLKFVIYVILFLLSLLVVARVLSYALVWCIVFFIVWITDRNALKNVDYCLFFTFAFFFIFIGNMERIPLVNEFLENIVAGHELAAGILASQFISNVPAALLISGFTSDYGRLLLGVNFGGLGTLIASMASLISYKLFVNADKERKQKYFLSFTGYNVFILVQLLAFYQLGLTFYQ